MRVRARMCVLLVNVCVCVCLSLTHVREDDLVNDDVVCVYLILGKLLFTKGHTYTHTYTRTHTHITRHELCLPGTMLETVSL